MLQVPYTYKIISINEEFKLIEVEYSAEGYETVLVSMPMPFEDADLDQHMAAYAPMYEWIIKHKKHKILQPGMSGTIEPLVVDMPEMPELSEEDVLKMIEALKSDSTPAA